MATLSLVGTTPLANKMSNPGHWSRERVPESAKGRWTILGNVQCRIYISRFMRCCAGATLAGIECDIHELNRRSSREYTRSFSRAILYVLFPSSYGTNLLVNDIGYMSTYHSFCHQNHREINMIINFQTSFTTHFTRTLLPLINNQPGLVVNVLSLTRRLQYPHLTVHSEGTAYLAGFSRALPVELEILWDPPVDNECLAVDVHNISSHSNSSASSVFVPAGESMGKVITKVVGCGHRNIMRYWHACLYLGWTRYWQKKRRL